MNFLYRLAADAVVVVHAGYVLFVVVGLLAVLLGLLFQWQWVRNFWFRMLHLLMIAVVVAEAAFGVVCPLTTWEKTLRGWAGQESYEGDFFADGVHDLLFIDAPQWMFTLAYTLFGIAVLATFLVVPPRWPRRKPPEDSAPPSTKRD